MTRRSIFDQIFREMQNVRHRLEDIEKSISNSNPQEVKIAGSELLELPDHLRSTYIIVASKGECSATAVSSKTGRTRAIESNYLNQLSRMGWLKRRRDSKTIYFRLKEEKIQLKETLQMGINLMEVTGAHRAFDLEP